VAFGQSDIRSAYATGRGGVVVRGEAEIVETKNGQFQIVITSLPYRVVKSNLIENIADLVRDKKIDGIKGRLRGRPRPVLQIRIKGNLINSLLEHLSIKRFRPFERGKKRLDIFIH
jgi:DNA gyrase/topoisomerase IV subunit A